MNLNARLQGINSIVSGKNMKTHVTLVNPPYPVNMRTRVTVQDKIIEHGES